MVEFVFRRAAAGRLGWLLALVLLCAQVAQAQIERPVTWKFAASPADKTGLVTFTATATIAGNWHIYSQFIEEGGPEPTSFKFGPSADYELVGKVAESPEPVKAFEKAFNMNIAYFPKRAVFSQKIRLKAVKSTVKGTVTFMVCNDEKCLPPDDLDFSVAVKGAAAPAAAAQSAPLPASAAKTTPKVASTPLATPAPAATKPADTVAFRPDAGTAPTLAPAAAADSAVAASKPAVAAATAQAVSAPATEQSLWAIFLAGFVGGLAALLMPCIFPLLPFTVSYFTKGEYSKAGSVGRAAFYGLSIIVIYVALGLLVTVVFGADALNSLATNGVFNLVFFALLVVFAASFLGAFELTLPNSWIAKTDTQADKGGLVGIFFMAATLALVSFSCTGPIIGTLLVQAASTGHLLSPALGMFGFSLALALPFTVFAAFPALLKSLPKSGGWLNSVKVVLGFLELALALKFLSNVDLAYHWQWFDREVFLSLWIIIFALLGFYLLGKIRFSHDSPLEYVSLPRLFLAIIVLAFTTYLVPGLWGAPLQAVAGFLPPQHTQDFDLYTPTLGGGGAGPAAAPHAQHKYGNLFRAPLGLDAYFDYDEARAYAQKVNKPILIDFTGNACVNCRKMEATVWPDPRVLQRLRNDFVLVQLYVDDKTELPANEQVESKVRGGKTIRTIGNKWSEFQASRYNANSQPFYVQLDPATERVLATPQGANYDPDNFVRFLDAGLAALRAGRR
ncbi:protein-disulfide reductase DsbD family protein [Hymenobacter sp. BRD67]|uniref:protein-disulfide reductase DsbD family protein n=1 Tax=Hymenobacter sp. BRD67 TaxID=2675877 RepID=UPI0015654E80|nr:cytochrome c biogenesis protein CcdA [Hymenobacter sp. BRD67]QKG54250.1 thioredoxin family protein [Hymenobacter sp. BRD67]